MSERKIRERVLTKHTRIPALIDPLNFEGNISSSNAAKRLSKVFKFNVDLWFDKHYHDRVYAGDKNGPREGIEENKVEKLVINSIQFLYHYASTQPTFSFINKPNETGFRKLRVVLRDIENNIPLSVVIECHSININSLEITVVTAMATSDFKLSDNQYCIEIEGLNSTLTRNVNGKEIIISEI